MFFLTVPYGNYGCQGGNVQNAFEYIIANEGVASQSTYGYLAKVNLCTKLLDDRYLFNVNT